MQIEDIFHNGIPEWLEILPDDWEGVNQTVKITLPVSLQAIKNKDFDDSAFLTKKLVRSLDVIRKKEWLCKLRILPILRTEEYDDSARKVFYFYIKYAKI